jgi:hypothetical protein
MIFVKGIKDTPLKLIPFSPISVISPLGNICRSCFILQALMISLNLYNKKGQSIIHLKLRMADTHFGSSSSWPKVIFSRSVAFFIQETCGTYATLPPNTTYSNFFKAVKNKVEMRSRTSPLVLRISPIKACRTEL